VPFTVLVVCTGNISRSPMTELLLRGWSDPRADLEVSSAGVAALVGAPMDPPAASVMGQLGLDPTRHRGRQLTAAMAERADLILTAERSHLETVLQQAPTALRRTFTVKEFARIAAHLEPAAPRDVVAQAATLRGLVRQPTEPGADDVTDPHGQPVGVSRATAAELTEAVRAIVGALGFSPAARPAPAKRRPLPYRR
jgi:protein-tyrosine phosphatase